MADADKAFGRVDVLVNVAALTDRGTIISTTPPELFDRMFAVNVRAPFFLMQDAAKIMRREKIEGAMINILSMSAHGGQPFLAAYSSSKGALAILTKNAAFALMPDHIRVNGLNIGWMDTPGEHASRCATTPRIRTGCRKRSGNSPSAACSSLPKSPAPWPISPATNQD